MKKADTEDTKTLPKIEKLNRVGQEYGNAAKKPEQKAKQSSSSESNENKPSGGKSLEEHAKKYF